ncbi:DUF7673 family protein [Ramlibacter sp.]|uniref:DUF7673 family protein n=1 Tax=Ramlibacter sp. TaxID=1917967 RepID=UPI003D0A89DB
MNKTERESRHRARMERINDVLVVCGRADRVRPDHEETLFERAKLLSEELGSHHATERGLEALERLLRAAEESRGRLRSDIAQFADSLWNGKALPLALLRGHEAAIAEDMVAVLDAYRWARLDLIEHVTGGPRRIAALVRSV